MPSRSTRASKKNGTNHSPVKISHDHDLDPKEFGPLTSTDYLYTEHHEPGIELPPDEEELPGYYVFLSTYLSYLVLNIVGHIRDFWDKLIDAPSAQTLKASNGYAPLFSDFDSFYTRRMKHRLADCFNRITTMVPGRFVTVYDRYSNDYNDNFIYPGTTTDCLNLSSYNYLGFAQSKGQCTDAAEQAILEKGIIGCSPRATGGTLDMHIETEKIIANFLGKDSALLYSMGYATNANIFASLMDKHCLVISDELNHASIRFGVRVSRAVIKIFKHNNMEELENLLREQISQGQPKTHRPWKKILVVVEGLYSMEGTMCNLPRLVELREKYKFYLFMDEAHSIGAMGPHGRGICDYFSIDPSKVDILMGTLTKSFGATGGYIVADKEIIDTIRVHNMGNIYSETTTAPVLGQIQAALKTITGEIRPGEGSERLKRIAFNSRYLRLGLRKLGFIVSGHEDSPIIPLMLYQPSKMPAFSRLLLERNIATVVVGYPATPLASSRVRLCVSAALTKDDLDRVIRVIDEVGGFINIKYSHLRSEHQDVDTVLATLVEDCKKEW